MSKYLERTQRLREDPTIHYNCAQTVIATFAAECGINQGKACQLGTFFGSGMRMAATCGAITGALMVIGMMGGGDAEYKAFMKLMRDNHDGLTDCAALLKLNAERGGEKRTHCDAMVFDAVENVVKVMGLE